MTTRNRKKPAEKNPATFDAVYCVWEREPKRTYVGELEWVIGQIILAHTDRNENRAAQIDGLCRYGNEVCIARRSRAPLPKRPTVRSMV